MKKLLLILTGVALTVGALATAGFVYAQTQDPPEADTQEEMPFGIGFMKGRMEHGWIGEGGFGWFGSGEEGPLHEYMFPALVDIFGLTDDQVEGFEVVKETIQSIRDGFTIEEIREKMDAAFTSAVEEAVADGVITREQADEMLERKEQAGSRHFGQGFGRFEGRGMRGFSPFEGRQGGIIQEYLDVALAEALDLSVEELQTMKEDGLNLRVYAEENGMSAEELEDLMAEVHTNAINAALEDGVITQEQADLMLSMVGQMGPRVPFGPGMGDPRGKRNNRN